MIFAYHIIAKTHRFVAKCHGALVRVTRAAKLFPSFLAELKNKW